MATSAIDLDWFAADVSDPSALANLESGWDACPTCGGLAYVETALVEADEYVVGCLDIDCGRRYVVVIP